MTLWIIQLLGLIIAIIGIFASWPMGEKKIWVRWGIFGAFAALAVVLFLSLILDWRRFRYSDSTAGASDIDRSSNGFRNRPKCLKFRVFPGF